MDEKVELFIPGELKDESVICDMIRNFEIDMKIVEASFSTESGWAYLLIGGDKKELGKLFTFLDSKGIRVDHK